MTKTQKIWLAVFLGMFLVPELLWSPVGNFIYELSIQAHSSSTRPFRDNFLQNSDNIYILYTVFTIQLIGLLITIIYLLIFREQFKNKLLFWLLIFVLFILAIVVFLTYGLSVSLRHIGF